MGFQRDKIYERNNLVQSVNLSFLEDVLWGIACCQIVEYQVLFLQACPLVMAMAFNLTLWPGQLCWSNVNGYVHAL